MTTGLVVKRTYGVFLLVWLFLVWFTGLVEFGLWDTVCRIPTNLAFLFRFCLAWFKLGLGFWCGDSVFFSLEVCMAAFVGKLLYCVMVIVGWDRWLFTTTSC